MPPFCSEEPSAKWLGAVLASNYYSSPKVTFRIFKSTSFTARLQPQCAPLPGSTQCLSAVPWLATPSCGLLMIRRDSPDWFVDKRYKYNYKWPLVFTFKLVAKHEHLI